jgi:hypothetical protein
LIQWLALLLLIASVGELLPARASADLYVRYFAGVAGGKPCYARNYSNAHLKAHPKQAVRRIEIDFDASWRDDKEHGGKNTGSDFQASIGFMHKRSREWYGTGIYCKTVNGHFECSLEEDGGDIRLVPSGNSLRLEVLGSDIHFEDGDVSTFGERGSDDRVFLLPRADRMLCEAAKPGK